VEGVLELAPLLDVAARLSAEWVAD
jgi:hypothetical protein